MFDYIPISLRSSTGQNNNGCEQNQINLIQVLNKLSIYMMTMMIPFHSKKSKITCVRPLNCTLLLVRCLERLYIIDIGFVARESFEFQEKVSVNSWCFHDMGV